MKNLAPAFSTRARAALARSLRTWLGMLTALICLAVSPAASSASFTVDTTTAPLTGLWWNENESGWGLNVTQQGPMVFAAWYAYEQSGAPVWYVMSSCPVTGDGCTGEIYSVTGGSPLAAPWNGAGKKLAKVGTGTLAFTDNNTGNFSYSLNGASGSRSIKRLVFATGTTPPAADYSALWWNADESGWGLTLTQQYGMIFANIYTYDADGKPVWYVASSCPVSGSGCAGPLYKASGGSAPDVAWNGANKVVTTVGNISFAFTDANTGSMTFTIDGVSGSKAIARQVFYTAPPSAGGGDSSSCVPGGLIANGATYQYKMRSSLDGSNVQESTNNFTVTAGVSFQGKTSTEVKTDTTITSGAGAGSTNTARQYYELTATQQIIYGLVNQTVAAGFSVNSTILFTPAITYPRVQNVGEAYTQTYKVSTTVSGLPLPPTEITQTTSRKFLGIERITVAAGTFNACKFEDTVTAAGSPAAVSTNWSYAGGTAAGAFLKSTSANAGQTTVTELVSATIPGGGALPAN